jgi:predicted methyltransferase
MSAIEQMPEYSARTRARLERAKYPVSSRRLSIILRVSIKTVQRHAESCGIELSGRSGIVATTLDKTAAIRIFRSICRMNPNRVYLEGGYSRVVKNPIFSQEKELSR